MCSRPWYSRCIQSGAANVYLRWNICGGLRKFCSFLQEWCFGHSRSSKVIDFDSNRKRVCDFLLVRNSNLGPILHRFGDFAAFMCSWAPFSTLIMGCSRCTRSPMLVAYVITVPDHGTWASRTDGQTDDILWHNRALRCIAWLKSVYIYRRYRKIKTGVPLFRATEYVLFSNCKLTTRAVHRAVSLPQDGFFVYISD